MDHIGIDVHKRESQICILTPEGEMIERRIQSTRQKFTTMFTDRPPARVLLEATTETEWVAQTIEALGHGATRQGWSKGSDDAVIHETSFVVQRVRNPSGEGSARPHR